MHSDELRSLEIGRGVAYNRNKVIDTKVRECLYERVKSNTAKVDSDSCDGY